MPQYRRIWRPGAVWFFTLNLQSRHLPGQHRNSLLTQHVDVLRMAVSNVRRKWPFVIHAFVVLPDHLHAILELPEHDADYALRWRLVKAGFSKRLPATEHRNPSRSVRGERGIWQRRYWARLLLDERDYRAHMDYVHFNPVKHGYAERVMDWPHSTFHRLVATGVYPADWAGVSTKVRSGTSDFGEEHYGDL